MEEPSRTSTGCTSASLGVYGLAFLAVAAFALTLPATRFALHDVGPLTVAFARASLAGLIALTVLKRETFALARQRPGQTLLATFGTAIGFPLLASFGMQRVPAAHGALIIAGIPMVITILNRLAGRERPGPAFWAFSLAAAGLVAGHALRQGGAGFGFGHLFLLLASVCAALSYIYGGILAGLARPLQVICLQLVLALPVSLLGLAASLAALEPLPPIASASWLGVAYLGLVSQLGGFIPWYFALDKGGMTRMSQVQLLQPFLTVLASAWLLSEPLDAATLATAAGVVGLIVCMRRAQVVRALPRGAELAGLAE